MSQLTEDADPVAVLRRLQAATNAHDIDSIVACFAPDYCNETPAHPARGFIGAEQVRRNWTQILNAIADLSVDVPAFAVTGDTVWSEWEHRGTRRDGSAHLMRGVIIFRVQAGRITAARLFLEPVDGPVDGPVDDGVAGVEAGVDAAVRHQVLPDTRP